MSAIKAYVDAIAVRPRVYLLVMFLAFIGLIYYGSGVLLGTANLKGQGFVDPNSESARTNNLFTDQFSPYPDLAVLLSHPTWTIDQPEYKAAYEQFKSSLTSSIPRVYSILSYFDYPTEFKAYSTDRKRTLVTAHIQDATNGPQIPLSTFQGTTVGNPLSFEFAGGTLASIAISSQLSTDLGKIEQGGIPVLLVILVLVFGGVVAILPTVCVVLWGLAMALAILRGIAQFYSVTTFATNATTIIGTGLAIDFSLFFHIRFTEEMKKPGMEVKAAVIKTLSTSGRSVVFSAVSLCCCLSALLQFSEYFVTTMSVAIMLTAASAAVGAIIIIPLLVSS